MNEEFKNKIVSDFGLFKMDGRQQEDMIEKIGNLLFESVVERSVDAMDEQLIDEFDAVVQNAGSNYDNVIAFLVEKVPNFEEIVSDELSRLKKATSGIFA